MVVIVDRSHQALEQPVVAMRRYIPPHLEEEAHQVLPLALRQHPEPI